MRILSIGIVLWVFSCPFLGFLEGFGVPSHHENQEEDLLEATFNDEACTNPCWQGLQVGVSSRQDVEAFLREHSLDYTTEGDYTYHVSLENDSPLWNEVSSPTADIHLGDNDKVYAMSFFLNLCASTVIEAYDEYPEVEETNGEILYLLYPAHGLIYWLNVETQRIVGVFLYQLEDFSDQVTERLAWNDVADGFVDTCVDALSQP